MNHENYQSSPLPYLRSASDAAIERGERLEKIVTLIQKRLDDVRYYHLEVQGADATLLVKVLKLAKGA